MVRIGAGNKHKSLYYIDASEGFFFFFMLRCVLINGSLNLTVKACEVSNLYREQVGTKCCI